jgi:hypothetical protein
LGQSKSPDTGARRDICALKDFQSFKNLHGDSSAELSGVNA